MNRLVHGLKGVCYSKKIESSWEQFSPVPTCLCPKYIKFCFKIWEKLEKIKMDVERLLLVLRACNTYGKWQVHVNNFWF